MLCEATGWTPDRVFDLTWDEFEWWLEGVKDLSEARAKAYASAAKGAR